MKRVSYTILMMLSIYNVINFCLFLYLYSKSVQLRRFATKLIIALLTTNTASFGIFYLYYLWDRIILLNNLLLYFTQKRSLKVNYPFRQRNQKLSISTQNTCSNQFIRCVLVEGIHKNVKSFIINISILCLN